MHTSQIIRAWKDADYRATLSAEQLTHVAAHPAGSRVAELDEAALQNVAGGVDGCGRVCTATYDCAVGYFEEKACDIYHHIFG